MSRKTADADVRFWLEADIQPPEIEVRSTPNSGHSEAHAGLPVSTQLGHLLSQTLGTINVVQYLKYSQLGRCSCEGGHDRSHFHRNTKQELEHV